MIKKNVYFKKSFSIFCIIFFSGCGSDSYTDCSDVIANRHSVIDNFSVELQSLNNGETFASTENS